MNICVLVRIAICLGIRKKITILNNKLISILKAILAILLYVIGIELIGSWFYLAEAIEF